MVLWRFFSLGMQHSEVPYPINLKKQIHVKSPNLEKHNKKISYELNITFSVSILK